MYEGVYLVGSIVHVPIIKIGHCHIMIAVKQSSYKYSFDM